MLKDVLQKIKSQRSEAVFFTAANIGSLTMAVAAGLYTSYETWDPAGIVYMVICGIVLALVLLYTVRTENFALGQFMTTLADACLLLPCGFLRFGGSNSGMPVCCMLVAISAAITTEAKYRKISMGIVMLVFVILFAIEIFFPWVVVPLDETARRTDIIFCVFFGCILMYMVVSKTVTDSSVLMEARMRSLEEKSRLYQELLESESEKNSLYRKFRHDAHHHNNVLMELLENGHTEKAIAYLKEYDSREVAGPGKKFCVNLTLNSILNYMDRICRKNGIVFQVSADAADHIPVAAGDFSAMASNILENAINEAMESGREDKKILFKAVTRGDRLTLICENPCRADVRVTGGMLMKSSTGVQSIMEAMKPYDGTLEYEKTGEDQIRCSLLLNLEYGQNED